MVPSSTCQSCGACCACYMVSFHWSEADPAQGGRVPPALVEPVDFHFMCMRGTSGRSPRCAGLEGTVGVSVRCGIYQARPTTCRDYGEDVERCNEARACHGLPPLEEPYSFFALGADPHRAKGAA